MSKPAAPISSLFHIPDRFQRSVQLERDFRDAHALDGYIVTAPMAAAFQQLADGLRPESGRRAWRITGDYGTGKSSFALVLAHLLHDPDRPAVAKIAQALAWPVGERAPPSLWPILVTGTREAPVGAIASGIAQALACRQPSAKAKTALKALQTQAEAVALSKSSRDLEALVEAVREQAAAESAGVLLVVDELGKILEHAGVQPEPDDVFVLQRLAELASRSANHPFLFVGLLHQGFQAYAARLPTTARHEWDKVAARFDEIVFDQPLAHTAALVAGALGVDVGKLPVAVASVARTTAEATAKMGWLSGGTSGAVALDAAPLYPVHPTLLPALVRFFARFGQHERSLFGFLLSEESAGLQAFSRRSATSGEWYGLPEFYDYIRAAYGHQLAGQSYRNHWPRISALVASAEELATAELRVLKTVAVLNLLDAEDLLPTDQAVAACLVPLRKPQVEAALQALVDRGLAHRRSGAGGYRLWPNTSVNLNGVLERASREVERLDRVAPHIQAFLNQDPLLARRHYIERGTLRYFEVRYSAPDNLEKATERPTSADGLVVVALADTASDRTAALKAASGAAFADRPDVIVGVGQPLLVLRNELLELRRWIWIRENTPELAHDEYAAEEVARQLSAAQRALIGKLSHLSGLRHRGGRSMTWRRGGKAEKFTNGLVRGLSDVCDELFPDAPQVSNELINRNALSSAAAAARMRLIEGMFTAPDKALLGIDARKAPPERSMYMSVLQLGGVHVETPEGFRLQQPQGTADVLNLQPALHLISNTIVQGRGDRVPVLDILSLLKGQPFGVRDGLAPLLLAIVLRTQAHELAVYENGTFLHRFGPTDYLRLTKGPHAFEVQHCAVEGVREDVFIRLATAFAKGLHGRRADILDVVTPLCQFAANLPEYTRRAGALTPSAAAVRDALLSAREPATLLFRDLPKACDLPAFDIDAAPDSERAQAFVAALQGAIDDLRAAYPQLIKRLIEGVSDAIGQARGPFDRVALAARAAKVSLVAREPRLRTFALRLRDPGLSEESWAESLASFVISRPPKKWGSTDEGRFLEEVGALAEVFHRVEAAAFDGGRDRPATNAVRLNLTRADGDDVFHVVHPEVLDSADLEALARLEERLPKAKELRLQFLTELLWRDLGKPPEVAVEASDELDSAKDAS